MCFIYSFSGFSPLLVTRAIRYVVWLIIHSVLCCFWSNQKVAHTLYCANRYGNPTVTLPKTVVSVLYCCVTMVPQADKIKFQSKRFNKSSMQCVLSVISADMLRYLLAPREHHMQKMIQTIYFRDLSQMQQHLKCSSFTSAGLLKLSEFYD